MMLDNDLEIAEVSKSEATQKLITIISNRVDYVIEN
jgi:hypothetical protein